MKIIIFSTLSRALLFLKRGELLYFMRLSYVRLISNFCFYLHKTYSMSDVDWPNLIKSYRGGQSTTIDSTTVSMNGQGTWHNKLFLSNLFLGAPHRNEPMDARLYKQQFLLQYLLSLFALGQFDIVWSPLSNVNYKISQIYKTFPVGSSFQNKPVNHLHLKFENFALDKLYIFWIPLAQLVPYEPKKNWRGSQKVPESSPQTKKRKRPKIVLRL